MDEALYQNVPAFRSRLSFVPLIEAWKRCGLAEKEARICHGLIDRFSQIPEFLQPVDSYSFLEQHKSLIDESTTTIFPVLMHEHAFYALATPFSYKVFYASPLFRKSFMDEKNNYILPLDPQVENNIMRARINLAYKIILNKFYGHRITGGDYFLCAYPEPKHDIHRYFELSWDPRFIHVEACIDLPKLPEKFLEDCHHIEELAHYEWLRSTLPIEQFIFEGILPISIQDVTCKEASSQIRNLLESTDIFEDQTSFLKFRDQLRYLLSNEKLETGITSFCGHPSLSGEANSILETGNEKAKEEIEMISREQLESATYFRTDVSKNGLILAMMNKTGKKHGLFAGLYDMNGLHGVISIYSDKIVEHEKISRLQEVLPHITHAVLKNQGSGFHKTQKDGYRSN